MSLSFADARDLTRWGYIMGSDTDAYSDKEKEDARDWATIYFDAAASEEERERIMWNVHEGYRQFHNVRESQVRAFLADRQSDLPTQLAAR